MESVKLLVRQVGIPDKGLDIISEAELNEYIQYQLTSQGYSLLESHYLDEVRDQSKNIKGYRFAFVFVKREELADQKTSEANEVTQTPKRLGRPPKEH